MDLKTPHEVVCSREFGNIRHVDVENRLIVWVGVYGFCESRRVVWGGHDSWREGKRIFGKIKIRFLGATALIPYRMWNVILIR